LQAQQSPKEDGRQISGINIKVKLGLSGKMFLQDMISLDILYIKECADKQLGIKSIELEVHMFGVQVGGILNGMKDMLGVAIGRIGTCVINYKIK
jgi:hypothetical protein